MGVTGAKKAASEVDQLRDKFDRLQKQGAKGFAIGAGAALTTAALGAVGAAVGKVTDFLSDSSEAFRENEVSVAQLDAALRSNVSGWEGHTAAIEEAITAGQKLAFDDELQREALTKLVGAYGNVTDALKQERLAMDLARFSGMGLLEASQLLINVHAGNFRGLRQLGISTKGVKTETQALGLIFDKVGGQATAYAETDLGKVEAANIRVEESQERLGNAISKLGTVAVPVAASALEGLIGALEGTGNFVISGVDGWQMLGDEISGTAEKEREAARETEAMARAQDNAKRATHGLTKEGRDLADSLRDVSGGGRSVSRDIDQMRRDLDRTAAAAYGLERAMDDLTDELFGATIKAGDLAEAKQELNAILKEGPESKSASDLAIWNGRLAEARQAVFDLEMQMAQTAGPEAFRDWLLQQKRILNDELNPELAETLNLLLQINAQQLNAGGGGKRAGSAPRNPGASVPAPVDVPHGALEPFAEGGVVPGPIGAPRPILAHGGETVIPVGGSGTVNNYFTFTGRVGDTKEDTVLALQRAAAFVRF